MGGLQMEECTTNVQGLARYNSIVDAPDPLNISGKNQPSLVTRLVSGSVQQQEMKSEMADVKEGAVVTKGHEECRRKLDEILTQFKLPLGLLPAEDMVELGFVEATGYVWIVQKEKVDHHFKLLGRMVSFGSEVTGYYSKEHIKKCSGVKAKKLLIWVPISDISIREDKTKIHMKTLAGVTKTFDVKAFALGE